MNGRQASRGKALIVGGGIGGMACAITLQRAGMAVDLVERDPQWRVYGAGITITGATFRAMRQLGILGELLPRCWSGHGIQVCDVQARPVTVLPTASVDDLPGTGGVMRPVLHDVLARRTLALGNTVRLGVTVQSMEHADAGIDVRLSDGHRARYDLVVGADGLFSQLRGLLFPQAPAPTYTGQNIWRVVAPRPPQIQRRHFFLGGPVKVGLTPVSDSEMYMFLLEAAPRRPVLADEPLAAELATLLAGYGGPLADVCAGLGPASRIVLRPLEALVLPPPWHRGRCVLVGDAAHPTTPQLASGAGMAIEDALVLGEELAAGADVPQALHAFMARRYERCRLVVENSMEIGRREQRRAPLEEQTRLVEESLRVLAQPI